MSVDTVEEAFQLKEELKEIFRKAGMTLAKFKSNCAEVIQDECDSDVEAMDVLEEESKTLGVLWHPKADTFQYRTAKFDETLPVTKHSILSETARIYDPCGFIGPIITTAKLIFQETWFRKVDWHDKVPEDLKVRWLEFMSDLEHIGEIKIPRCISPLQSVSRRELHIFCDASKRAYGAVVYVVSSDDSGNRSSRMLTSKSRVSPYDDKNNLNLELIEQCSEESSEQLTIPRAELCGAVMAVELAGVVATALHIEDCFFWTDATVILCQIHNPKPRQDIFVKRRVREILAGSEASQWRHVSTTQNPADLLSRGATVRQLAESSLWWTGPSWLCNDPLDWNKPFIPSECSLSGRIRQIPQAAIQSVSSQRTEDGAENTSVYQTLLQNISSITRMKRTLAWVIRACQFFRERRHRTTRSVTAQRKACLSTTELRNAETYIIRWAQQEAFGDLFKAIQRGKLETTPKLQSLRKLRPFIDSDNILRVGGRLARSHENFDVKHPKLLPKGRLSELIIRRSHVELLHAGPQLEGESAYYATTDGGATHTQSTSCESL
ncbi:uncharacterized protein LOC129786924 [Lutzomyia longipalpis]|uniref:uncharacterized protein LOC129786924 n=1 Tax=Lutzomyia longipalpis TaxID=7200 RepID=UPI0024847183|nr:uncharacterized protein LOC129786924 [Lutzomyia longipalpis]